MLTCAAQKLIVSENSHIGRIFKGTGVVSAGIECSPKIFEFRANGIPVRESVDFVDTLTHGNANAYCAFSTMNTVRISHFKAYFITAPHHKGLAIVINSCCIGKAKGMGGVRVKNYKDIENTRYIISRVFAENKTTAMLIEQRVKDMKNNALSLEVNGGVVYNMNSSSIQSREGL